MQSKRSQVLSHGRAAWGSLSSRWSKREEPRGGGRSHILDVPQVVRLAPLKPFLASGADVQQRCFLYLNLLAVATGLLKISLMRLPLGGEPPPVSVFLCLGLALVALAIVGM